MSDGLNREGFTEPPLGVEEALAEVMARAGLPPGMRDLPGEDPFPDGCTCLELEDSQRSADPDCPVHVKIAAECDALRALLDHETRLTWQSGLPGERARVAGVRERAGLEALA